MTDKQLTPNFNLKEFLKPGHKLPGEVYLNNITNLAHRLQVVRDIIGKPIKITSGYRTISHNQSVGGAPNSYHLYGMAADIVVDGLSARELQKLLKNWSGGMGCYDTFTHLDIRENEARW